MTHRIRIAWMILAAGALFSSGCRPVEVNVYDVPKERVAAAPRPPERATDQAPLLGEVRWTKPEAWEELPPTAFRKGNYVASGPDGSQAEITVTSFPGNVGGLLANVNRWRGQAGLDPISEDELTKSLSLRTIDGQEGQIVDILPDSDEPTAARILAAIFLYNGNSWFFKLSGPQSVVAAEKDNFDAFIDSLRFSDCGDTPQANDLSPSNTQTGELAFDPPQGWTPSSGSSLRLASYEIKKEGFPPADFSITSFPGDAGGMMANVNRWRKQIGLDPWTEREVEAQRKTIKVRELTFAFFDLKPVTEAEKNAVSERIFAAFLKHNDRTWFYKLKGDVFLLETQRKNFRQIIETSRFKFPANSAE